MQVQITPANFTRIMSLPGDLRHDVLEFLGSTPVDPASFDTLLHTVLAAPRSGLRTRASSSGRN